MLFECVWYKGYRGLYEPLGGAKTPSRSEQSLSNCRNSPTFKELDDSLWYSHELYTGPPPGKIQISTSIGSWPLTTKSFPIHYSPAILLVNAASSLRYWQHHKLNHGKILGPTLLWRGSANRFASDNWSQVSRIQKFITLSLVLVTIDGVRDDSWIY
jgi:hypothetical protein